MFGIKKIRKSFLIRKEFSRYRSKRDEYRSDLRDYGLKIWPYAEEKLALDDIKKIKKGKIAFSKEKLKPEEMPFYVENKVSAVKNEQEEVENDMDLDLGLSSLELVQMKNRNREVLLLGTNHNLNYSHFLTLNYLKRFKPESIVVEICKERVAELYQNYEFFPDSKINEILESQKFPKMDGFEFIIPFIYRDFVAEHDVQIILGDLDSSMVDSAMKKSMKLCQCTHKPSYFDIMSHLAKVKLNSLMNKKFDDKDIEIFKYNTVNKYCIRNRISMKRELSMVNAAVRYSKGTSVMIVMGINHLDRVKEMLEIYENLDCKEDGEFEDIAMEGMKEYGECR